MPRQFQSICRLSASVKLAGRHSSGATAIVIEVNACTPTFSIIFCEGRNTAQNTVLPSITSVQPQRLISPLLLPPAISSATPANAATPHSHTNQCARSWKKKWPINTVKIGLKPIIVVALAADVYFTPTNSGIITIT